MELYRTLQHLAVFLSILCTYVNYNWQFIGCLQYWKTMTSNIQCKQSRWCRCVSSQPQSTHKGQKKLVSVNVVLVLNLHFNFISEDSNKRYSFADQMAKGGGLMFALVLSSQKAFVVQSTLNEASSGTQNSRGLYKSVSKTTDDLKTSDSSAVVATSKSINYTTFITFLPAN